MPNLIDHIVEPSRLLLTWQEAESRRHFHVGTLQRDQDGEVSFSYTNGDEQFSEAVLCGFTGFPAFRGEGKVFTNQVTETFLKRLPPRSRPDFDKFLRNHCFSGDASVSDFALLGYTGAKLPSDRFALLLPIGDFRPPFEFVTEISGFRHWACLDDIQIGNEVDFVPEPENEFDNNALAIYRDDKKIGYVNRILAPELASIVKMHGFTATIQRINGTEERPLVYLFVSIT